MMMNITAFVGTNVTLECNAVTEFASNFIWRKWIGNSRTNQTFQIIQSRSLNPGKRRKPGYKMVSVSRVLVNVSVMDSGRYSCLVINSRGEDSTDMHLKVIERISVTTKRPTLEPIQTNRPTRPVERQQAASTNDLQMILSIVLSVALGVFFILLISILCYYCSRRYYTNKKAEHHVIDETGADDITRFRSPALSSTSTASCGSNAPLLHQRSYRSRMASMPECEIELDDTWEIDRCQISIVGELGEGAFGRVVKAEAIALPDMPHECTVAVKMLKDPFVTVDQGNPYNLRGSSTKLQLPRPNNEFFKNSFGFSGAKLWNRLRSDMHHIKSLPSFKNKLKAIKLVG